MAKAPEKSREKGGETGDGRREMMTLRLKDIDTDWRYLAAIPKDPSKAGRRKTGDGRRCECLIGVISSRRHRGEPERAMTSSTVYRLPSHRFYCPMWFHILPEALSKNQWSKDVIYRLPSTLSPVLLPRVVSHLARGIE